MEDNPCTKLRPHTNTTNNTDLQQTHNTTEQTVIHYRKADWDKFTQDTEDAFTALQPPTDIHDANKTFTNILYQAGKKHIPVGRIRNTDNLLPQPIRNKIAHRNLTSKNTPHDPSIPELNKEISTIINTNKTEIWREHIEKPWDHRRNKSTYWNTIHGLAHKRQPQQDNTQMNPKDIASAFNKQFINTIPHKTNTTNRKSLGSTQSTANTDKHHNCASPNSNQKQQEQQLNRTRPHQLPQNIGKNGLQYLTNIYNAALNDNKIPHV